MATPQYSFLDNPDIIEILGMEEMDKTVEQVAKILRKKPSLNDDIIIILANISILDFTYVRQIAEFVPHDKTYLYYGHMLYHYMNMPVDIFLEILDLVVMNNTSTPSYTPAYYVQSPIKQILRNKNIPANLLYAGIEKFGSDFLNGKTIERFIDFTKPE